jgi:hypothetical protein
MSVAKRRIVDGQGKLDSIQSTPLSRRFFSTTTMVCSGSVSLIGSQLP